MERSGKVANDAVAAMREMYDRVVAGDWDGYRAMLSEDYVSLGPDGSAKDRERTVADWRERAIVLKLDVNPIVAREAGEVVFVLSNYACIDEKDGATREFEGSMFEVWRPTAAGWRCMATHFT